MKNTFKILFLLVITLVILSLASCGNNVIDLPDDSEQSTEAPAGENEVNGSEASTCNHEYEEKILVAATCQKEGISKKTCKLCGATENGTVPKAMHVEVIDPAIAATCSEPGKTEGAHCMNCNTVLKERETVEPLGHTEVIDEAIAATCTTPGKTEGKHCSVCNEVTLPQETVDALGHTEVIDAAIPATCTTSGKTEGKHCSVCNEITLAQETVDALGHTEIIDTAISATCTLPGRTEGKHCSTCNTILIPQEPTAALGHTEVIDPAIAATCTAPGKTEGKHCSVCNKVTLPQETVDALGHSTVKRTHTPVTCQANGIVEIYCTRCETVQNYETILKGHYPADHEYTQITHDVSGDLCVGYKHGDKCEECGVRFIAPGTYTIIGFGYWEGTVQFKFDYYNNLGTKQSASKITHYIDDKGDWTLKFDDYIVEGCEYIDYSYEGFKNYSGTITITEENFAIVDQTFYDIFLRYFEAGEYTLSGKYIFDDNSDYILSGCPRNIEYVNFKYLDTAGNEYYSTFIQCVETGNAVQMNYSNKGNVYYYDYWDEYGYFNRTLQLYVIFETPQTVSKDFFEWFTSVADKQIA